MSVDRYKKWEPKPLRSRVPTAEDLANYSPHGPKESEPELPHLKLRCFGDVTPQPVEWLWPGRLASGKFNLLGGDPGQGKSHFTIDLAARITTGSPFPDGSGRCPMGQVLILSAEDDAEDTIRPRLDRAGADVSKVHEIQLTRDIDIKTGKLKDRCFNLERDLPLLEQSIRGIPDLKLLTIDPLSAYLGDVDGHKNEEVRALLAPLCKLAAELRFCVLGVTHLNKSSGTKSTYRMTGSLAFAAAARAVWMWAEDKEQPGRVLMLQVKNNLAKKQDGLACRIASDELGSYIHWEADPVAMTADGLLEKESAKSEPDDGRMGEACDFLRELLASGPMLSKDVDEAARTNDIAKRTLGRARKSLGCKPYKRASDGKWEVSLPESELCQSSSNGIVGNVGIVGRHDESW